MMARGIGYYVHHHGAGHRQRGLAIARAAAGRITLLGTGLAGHCGEVSFLYLPDDCLEQGRFDGQDDAGRPASLHYAPTNHDGIRRRVAAVATWIADTQPLLMVLDVSVEIAMLARLASVPTVYVRLSGHRNDRPHVDAFAAASALLAPFHRDLDDERTQSEVRRKTFYAPGIVEVASASKVETSTGLVVHGLGSGPADGEMWAAAAASSAPHLTWRVLGPCTVPPSVPDNLEFLGWRDDPEDLIASAGIVVGAAGDGMVGSVIASRRPFICLPEARPFDEQTSKARRLAALGAAIVCLTPPSAHEWPDLLGRARALDPDRLAHLDGREGAGRVASWLRDLAEHPNHNWSQTA
jgi:hypothetical protein